MAQSQKETANEKQRNGQGVNGTGPYPLYRAPSFRISIPEDWKDRAAYIFVGPPSGASLPTLMINCDRESHYASLKEFADEEVNKLQTSFYGSKLLFDREVSLPDGSPAREALFRWEAGGEQRLFQRKLYVISGKTAFTVTTVFVDETGEGRNRLCESVLESFQPTEI